MKDIAIIGGGGLGREVIALIKIINETDKKWNVIGFFDDNSSSDIINDFPVLGPVDMINEQKKDLAIVIAIGNPLVKESIFKKINNAHIYFPNIVHPSSIYFDLDRVKLGIGCIFFANTVFTTDIAINDFVFVNNNVSISHDVVIGSFSTLMPMVSISCKTDIGRSCFIGNNTVICKETNINNGTKLVAGTIVSN